MHTHEKVHYSNLYYGEKGIGHEKHCNKFKDKYKSLFNSNQIAQGGFAK